MLGHITLHEDAEWIYLKWNMKQSLTLRSMISTAITLLRKQSSAELYSAASTLAKSKLPTS